MPSILFVGTGNQYRSPIAAAAFLRQLNRRGIANQWTVRSAGTWTTPDQPPPPNAVRVAHDVGLDILDHTTRIVTADELSRYDLVLVMERDHKEELSHKFPVAGMRLHLLSEVVSHLDYDISDPADPRSLRRALLSSYAT